MKTLIKSKKGEGIVTSLISGVGSLIIGVIITLVIVSTLLGANLLNDQPSMNATVHQMSANFTAGIDNVSSKIPTILLIAAVVLLFGVLVLLVAQSQRMGIGGGGQTL